MLKDQLINVLITRVPTTNPLPSLPLSTVLSVASTRVVTPDPRANIPRLSIKDTTKSYGRTVKIANPDKFTDGKTLKYSV